MFCDSECNWFGKGLGKVQITENKSCQLSVFILKIENF